MRLALRVHHPATGGVADLRIRATCQNATPCAGYAEAVVTADAGRPQRSILFVDDDDGVLEGLRNRLRRRRNEWHMSFARSGEAALELLAAQGFDVLVTDARMPGMDGAALLQQVRQRHPNIIRVVLSGHAEVEAALRTVPVAHQFIAKPCEPGVLENVIERACALQELVNDAKVRRIVGMVSGLPALPQLYARLRSMLSNPGCSTHEIAMLIEQDLALSAKVLQLVNSAFFRLPRAFARIENAIVYLGFDVVSRIVLAGELFDVPPQREHLAEEILQLRDHSLATASIASKLMSDTPQQDDAFLAGLLHDVGKLLLAVHLPEHFESALQHAKRQGVDLHAAEIDLCGVSHAEIGAYLLGIWGLPHYVVEAVANHHRPTRVEDPSFGVLGAVHVGNILAHRSRGEPSANPDSDYLARHHLTEQWAEWEKRFSAESS